MQIHGHAQQTQRTYPHQPLEAFILRSNQPADHHAVVESWGGGGVLFVLAAKVSGVTEKGGKRSRRAR